jgi:pectinesterase
MPSAEPRPYRRPPGGRRTRRRVAQLFAATLLVTALPALAPGAADAQRAQGGALRVTAQNPLELTRPDEILTVPWSLVRERLPAARRDRVRVREAATGREVVSQVVDADGDGTPDELIFLADFWPHETREFLVEPVPATAAAARVHVRHDGYRDDVAWENELIAFRIYGQGLWNAHEYQPLVSNGIDVWPKRVRDLVVERWYAKGHDAYHLDTGEGADFFTVGPTLGAGGTAVWADGAIHRARNFVAHRILANGPIRGIFELEYEPWEAAGLTVAETKKVTIDAGRHLYRSESTFRFAGVPEITYAVGFVKRDGLVGSSSNGHPRAWLTTWGPVERKNGGHGKLGTAVLVEPDALLEVRETGDHYLLLGRARSGNPVAHDIGVAWTASGDFADVESWWRHLQESAVLLASPVRLTFGAGRSAAR